MQFLSNIFFQVVELVNSSYTYMSTTWKNSCFILWWRLDFNTVFNMPKEYSDMERWRIEERQELPSSENNQKN